MTSVLPYPTLLRRAVSAPARPGDRYSLIQTDFPREFAEFIDFVGAQELDKEIRKIEKRFSGKDAKMRSLYRDRYFFQEQCIRFTEDIPSFGLNISNPIAVRAASLIAGVNHIRKLLSPNGASRFRSMVDFIVTYGKSSMKFAVLPILDSRDTGSFSLISKELAILISSSTHRADWWKSNAKLQTRIRARKSKRKTWRVYRMLLIGK
jgi:hypothetical protein